MCKRNIKPKRETCNKSLDSRKSYEKKMVKNQSAFSAYRMSNWRNYRYHLLHEVLCVLRCSIFPLSAKFFRGKGQFHLWVFRYERVWSVCLFNFLSIVVPSISAHLPRTWYHSVNVFCLNRIPREWQEVFSKTKLHDTLDVRCHRVNWLPFSLV